MANEWYGQQQSQQRNNNNLMAIPVQGEEAAQNYLVAAGCTVLLIDLNSKNQRIWLKSNDQNGLIQNIRTFKVEEITPKPKTDNNFIQRKEFEQFQTNINSQFQQITKLLNQLGGLKQNESTNTDVVEQSKTTTAKVQ